MTKPCSILRFPGFSDASKLCYVIIIDDGPIWSIKFHPNESSIDKRVGILAVATANQSVLLYSLPYLNNEESLVLPLKPVLNCKLEDGDVFFNDQHLLQATRVAWFSKAGCDTVLAAGYVSGTIALWKIAEDITEPTIYPHHVILAHMEPITALDFKATNGSDFHLLTASLDRKLKVFLFDDVGYQEIASYYATSRVLAAEWWQHWPGYLMGFDDCFTFTSFIHRQPLEFASRNTTLCAVSSSIVHININHGLNFVMFVTDAGDVIGCSPHQMFFSHAKDKWSHYKFNVFACTDFNRITSNGVEEIAVVFNDFKVSFVELFDDLKYLNFPLQQNKTSHPKKLRLAPTDRINELQINQVCFNRNPASNRFYAMGYETGFVRVRYLKNSK